MKPKQRVLETYKHNEPDQVPVCIGGTAQKFSKSIYLKIKEVLGITEVLENENLLDELNNVIYYHPRVLEHFGTDFRYIQINRMPPKRKFEDGSWENELGYRMRFAANNEIVSIVSHPLREHDMDSLDGFNMPDPGDRRRFEGLKDEAEKIYKENVYAVALYKCTLGGIFDTICSLRGMDKFFMDMVTDRRFTFKLIDKVFEYIYLIYENTLREVGPYLDVVEFNDDLGTQDNLMLSPDHYREYFKPYHKKLVDMFKKYTKNSRIFIHCCGAIYDIIPDFIEIGIDILNPIQPLANNMDSKNLKKEFGNDLIFQGGIDLQRAMIGSTDKVKKEVAERISTLAPGGGYVFATSNNIMGDIPVDNVFKLYEFARELGKYPIKT